jgi:hypothetical protein
MSTDEEEVQLPDEGEEQLPDEYEAEKTERTEQETLSRSSEWNVPVPQEWWKWVLITIIVVFMALAVIANSVPEFVWREIINLLT